MLSGSVQCTYLMILIIKKVERASLGGLEEGGLGDF
jgi:hypothetical protein